MCFSPPFSEDGEDLKDVSLSEEDKPLSGSCCFHSEVLALLAVR